MNKTIADRVGISNWLIVVKTDLKNVFRDKSISVVFFVPFIFMVLLYYAQPYYEAWLPVLVDYRMHVLAFFSVMVAGLLGFVLSFILLDEIDLGLKPVFQILPIPYRYLVVLRVLFISSYSFIVISMLITVSAHNEISVIKAMLLAVMCSITAPFSAFVITSIAKNKIEAVTYFKLFNSILMLPIIGLFIQSGWSYAFWVFPQYWIYASFVSISNINLEIIVAVFSNLLLLYLSFRLFMKR